MRDTGRRSSFGSESDYGGRITPTESEAQSRTGHEAAESDGMGRTSEIEARYSSSDKGRTQAEGAAVGPYHQGTSSESAMVDAAGKSRGGLPCSQPGSASGRVGSGSAPQLYSDSESESDARLLGHVGVHSATAGAGAGVGAGAGAGSRAPFPASLSELSSSLHLPM